MPIIQFRSWLRRMSHAASRSQSLFLLPFAGAMLAGCATVDRDMDIPMGRAFEPANFTHEGPLPASLKRVAVLPMYSRVWTDAEMDPLEAAMLAELGKYDRFELSPVSRDAMDEMFGIRAVGTSEAVPADLVARLRSAYGADGVLMVDLTHYHPYQPLGIGVRSKLVDLSDGRVLWSFDEIFDVSQPEVAVAARKYYLDKSRQTYPLGHTSGILQSPARFAKYVGSAMFGTLPPRGSS